MKKIRNILVIAVTLLILLFIANKASLKYPDYVLLKNGVFKSDIILEMKKSIYYNSYLYKGKDNTVKYIVIGKNNSGDYAYKVLKDEELPINAPYNYIYSIYPDVATGGIPKNKCVLAGYVNLNKIKKPQFLIKGINTITPTLYKSKGDILYFIYDSGMTLQGNTASVLIVKNDDNN
jgi:hypothetical protein